MNIQEIAISPYTINKERFVSIKDVQKSPTKSLTGFKIIMKNATPQGVYIDMQDWENLMEDIQANTSQDYKDTIKKSRASKKHYTREEILKKYNLSI